MKTTTIRTIIKRIMMLITIILLVLSSYIDTHYTRDARVDSIENNVVTFIDTCGYIWEAANIDNIVEGQIVVLKMHTNHTDSIISDDVIVGIKPTAITLQ